MQQVGELLFLGVFYSLRRFRVTTAQNILLRPESIGLCMWSHIQRVLRIICIRTPFVWMTFANQTSMLFSNCLLEYHTVSISNYLVWVIHAEKSEGKQLRGPRQHQCHADQKMFLHI